MMIKYPNLISSNFKLIARGGSNALRIMSTDQLSWNKKGNAEVAEKI